MSRALRLVAAVVAAVAVETMAVWLLTQVVMTGTSIAFAVAFVAGYLTLFTANSVLSHAGTGPPLSTQLRAYGLFGLAALLVVEATVYVCDGLLHTHLAATNAVVLLAVACWIALSWRIIDRNDRP